MVYQLFLIKTLSAPGATHDPPLIALIDFSLTHFLAGRGHMSCMDNF